MHRGMGGRDRTLGEAIRLDSIPGGRTAGNLDSSSVLVGSGNGRTQEVAVLVSAIEHRESVVGGLVSSSNLSGAGVPRVGPTVPSGIVAFCPLSGMFNASSILSRIKLSTTISEISVRSRSLAGRIPSKACQCEIHS